MTPQPPKIRWYICAAYAAAVVMFFLIGGHADAGGTRPEYRPHFTATKAAKTWQSQQRWSAHDTVFIQAYVDGREVPGVGGAGSCRIKFTGRGVLVRVNLCGPHAPMRLTFRSLTVREVPFVVRYGQVAI